MKRSLLIAIVVAAAAASAANAAPQLNSLRDSSAETGLGAWQGSGVATVDYATTGVPFTSFGAEYSGTHLFVLAPGAAIEQTIGVSDQAAVIDGGTSHLLLGGFLGGLASQSGGAQLIAQPLSATGRPLGAVAVLGPPSDRDRQSRTMMLSCDVSPVVPVGTRAIRVVLQTAGGSGIADELYADVVADVVTPAVAPPPDIRQPNALGCAGWEHEPMTGLVHPTSGELFLINPPPRSKTRVRVKLTPRWRTNVRSFSVTARGRTTTGAPTRTIAIKAPRCGHRLTITITASMVDGTTRKIIRRYRRPCS